MQKPLKTEGKEAKPSPHYLPVQNAELKLPIPRQQPGNLQFCSPFCTLSDCLELDDQKGLPMKCSLGTILAEANA